jgi:hypothetical protein
MPQSRNAIFEGLLAFLDGVVGSAMRATESAAVAN